MSKIQLVPRVQKRLTEQKKRTKKKAEVYTPIWLVKKMADHAEEILNSGNWKQFIGERCLEITCGEAPFITSRYDPTTGEMIDIQNRVGVLDRKLKAISENLPKELGAHSDPALMWWEYAECALQSTYAYEWQGDSLLLARINLYLTFCECFKEFTGKEAEDGVKRAAAFIISWNVWQMDGLKDTVPCTNILCRIKDWETGDEILFRKIKEESDNMCENRPTFIDGDKAITDYLPPKEILAGLAEEFAEGSQAALKLRRVLDGSNPTPKTLVECSNNLQEECADVLLCLTEYLIASGIDIEDYFGGVRKISERKATRWLMRLQEKEAKNDVQN